MANSTPINMDMEMNNTSTKSPFGLQATSPPLSGGFFKAHVILRLLATILSLAAISLMITSSQSTYLFSVELKARYTYSSAFRFSIGTDVVVCVCSVLSLIATCALAKLNPASQSQKCDAFYLFIFLHDLATAVLAVSGCAASTAIGYIALHGQDRTGWTEICSQVNLFCNKVMVSIALSYVAFLCFFALAILSFVQASKTKVEYFHCSN